MFDQLKNVQILQELSRNPINIATLLTEERIKRYTSSQAGWKILYATEKIEDNILRHLFALAGETNAIGKMRAMQEGQIVNTIEGVESEHRPALHTALRDFFDQPMETAPSRKVRDNALEEIQKLRLFLDEIDREKRFSCLLQIGIGGSFLGPCSIYHALKAYQKPNRHISFLSNIDPDEVVTKLNELNLDHSLIVCVSKSGTTLESITNEEFVREALKKRGLVPSQHMVAITTKGSPMDDSSRYREIFYIDDSIGGRYSVTSMVGGVVLGFAIGFDNFWKFLEGAHRMDVVARSEQMEKNLPLLTALFGIWNRNFLHYPTLAIIPYSQALHHFIAHLQQCDMESNGKSISKEGKRLDYQTGPIIWGESGTNGQHSFFQFLHQGTDIVPIEFIGFRDTQHGEDLIIRSTSSQEKFLSNLFAQIIALATGKMNDSPNKICLGNRPSHLLIANKLDPHTMGALLSLYEHKIAFQGFIWDINSFDQEGVQFGKTIANQIIDYFASQRDPTKKVQPFPIAMAFLSHLNDL